jgi:hypothetical protein
VHTSASKNRSPHVAQPRGLRRCAAGRFAVRLQKPSPIPISREIRNLDARDSLQFCSHHVAKAESSTHYLTLRQRLGGSEPNFGREHPRPWSKPRGRIQQERSHSYGRRATRAPSAHLSRRRLALQDQGTERDGCGSQARYSGGHCKSSNPSSSSNDSEIRDPGDGTLSARGRSARVLRQAPSDKG